LKIVFDTSFLLEIRRGNIIAQEEFKKSIENASDIGISIITLYELYLGAFLYYLRRHDPSELDWLENILGWLTIYPVNTKAAEVAAKIKAESSLKGLNISDSDILIATSAGPGTTLLTFDSDHESIKDILSLYNITVIYLEKKNK